MKHKFLTIHPKCYRNPIAEPLTGRRRGIVPRVTTDYKMDKEDWDELTGKFDQQAQMKLKGEADRITSELNTKYDAMVAGLMKKEDFELFKTSAIKELNDNIKTLESIVEKQGNKINELMGPEGFVKPKSMEEYLGTILPDIKKYRGMGAGNFEVTSTDLRKAGVHNIRGGSKAAIDYSPASGASGSTTASIIDMSPLPGGSPWLPGLGGSDLELFEIVRNPNFIINHVDVGRTNQSLLAWVNEISYDGTPNMDVAPGGAKPQTSHKFQVEFSKAKKAAAYIEILEEFEDDLPGLATAVRRMLQQDVMRSFDDQIQTQVIAAARPYEITGLFHAISRANLWDAIGAELAQVGFYNFIPNTVALNSVTDWQVYMQKAAGSGEYLMPPFLDRINRYLVDANKIATGFGLAGDLTQYKVDIYKDFTLRVGWINDDFIKNKFAIVGELRYHSYIADSRKKAIVYDNLATIMANIGTSGS